MPIKRHLDDLLDLIDIMMSDDKTARKISLNGQKYAREHLAPHNILGYYLLLFQVSLKEKLRKKKIKRILHLNRFINI